MFKKEDISTVADIFEINTLQHWCTTSCVIKTQRYGYIRDSGVFEYLSIYCSLKKTLLDNILSKIQGDDRMRIKIILNFMTAV